MDIIDNELLLADRLGVIKDTISKYGEENFYVSFSGGKDSTVVSYLLDMAIPGNTIPRVFINTGIEYKKIVDFVRNKKAKDDRFIEILPHKSIKETLEKEGYPFKSKYHSRCVNDYKAGKQFGINYYEGTNIKNEWNCPAKLKYQFETEMSFKISAKCCDRMKKDPFKEYIKKTGRGIAIIGLMREEGGQRALAACIVSEHGKVKKFNPLAVMSQQWENWLINKEKIQLCELYYEPYNFARTGCKGCPYNLRLQDDLETMEKYMPEERKQCEWIWKPVYDEYRRLGYRLKKTEQMKLL